MVVSVATAAVFRSGCTVPLLPNTPFRLIRGSSPSGTH